MLSISEQIHLYQELKAKRKGAAQGPADNIAIIERKHPSAIEFFKELMQRWQTDYQRKP